MIPADPIRLFVGYDRREPVVNWVFKDSVLDKTSIPVAFQDVSLRVLEGMGAWWRKRDPLQSTDFSLARFMVPWMCGFKGWAVFADGDMLCRGDLAKLWELRDDRYAVRVVRHEEYQPEEAVKFLGQAQTRYQRKNWSSVMLFNCEACTVLTPEYANSAPPCDLHQFAWVRDSAVIGALPLSFNHLVGVYPYDKHADIVHFTAGAPIFKEYALADYADEWWAAYWHMTHCEQNENSHDNKR